MSEKDMDVMPRMKDTLRPEDLNTDACANLAGEIMKGLANDYIMALRKYRHHPTKENQQALQRVRKIYLSDWFGVLSCGLVDGQAVMAELNRRA